MSIHHNVILLANGMLNTAFGICFEISHKSASGIFYFIQRYIVFLVGISREAKNKKIKLKFMNLYSSNYTDCALKQ